MKKKNATQVKPVRFPDFNKFRFYGFTFELPVNVQFIEIEIVGKRYVAHVIASDSTRKQITLRGCFGCKRLLLETDFYKAHAYCCECHKVLVKKWAKNNPELVKKYAKKYNKKYRYEIKLIELGIK